MKNKSVQNILIEDCNIYKLAVENSFNHVIITDPEGKILYANKAAEKMTGFTYKQMKGKTPKLWGRQMDKKFYGDFWKTIKSDMKPFHGEVKNRRKNGQDYYAIVTVSPIFTKDKKLAGYLGIEEDITEIKELDQRKTEFISIASHQLRTPLGSMRWNIEMLLGNEFGKLPKEIKNINKMLYASTLRMISLVNDLLSVSRIEQKRVFDEPKLIDLEKLIRETSRDVELEAQKKSISGELRFPKKRVPKIMIDPKLFRETFVNLLTNAIKYNRKKGKIIITVKQRKNHLLVSVSDTGIGIPKKDRPKIFSKHFRAENAEKSENEGSGLGLFIVKSYIEKWGGKIRFTSKIDSGTTFSFTLPLKPKKITI